MNKTVTIGCPISNRGYLIERYLKGILNLDYDKKLIKIYFLYNSSKDSTLSDLQDFRRKYLKDYLDIKIEKYKIQATKDKRSTKTRLKTYTKLAELRNHFISNIDTDYLFSLDSDIMIEHRPDCLNELINADKDIIAAVINNDAILNPTLEYPQVRTNLLVDDKGYIRHYLNFPLNKIVEVGYTGACYLLKNEVLKNVRYGFDKQGEDIYFCRMAKEKGYGIYAHTGVILYHLMREYQNYCIENKCQNPCMIMNKKYMYAYKYLDNEIYPDIINCPRCEKGTMEQKALMDNVDVFSLLYKKGLIKGDESNGKE